MTSVTVIVPAYNEGSTFAGSLVTIAEYFSLHERGGYQFNYLIVDDGSSDETYSLAQTFAPVAQGRTRPAARAKPRPRRRAPDRVQRARYRARGRARRRSQLFPGDRDGVDRDARARARRHRAGFTVHAGRCRSQRSAVAARPQQRGEPSALAGDLRALRHDHVHGTRLPRRRVTPDRVQQRRHGSRSRRCCSARCARR